MTYRIGALSAILLGLALVLQILDTVLQIRNLILLIHDLILECVHTLHKHIIVLQVLALEDGTKALVRLLLLCVLDVDLAESLFGRRNLLALLCNLFLGEQR